MPDVPALPDYIRFHNTPPTDEAGNVYSFTCDTSLDRDQTFYVGDSEAECQVEAREHCDDVHPGWWD